MQIKAIMKCIVVLCVRVCMCCFLFCFCICVTAFSSLSEKVLWCCRCAVGSKIANSSRAKRENRRLHRFKSILFNLLFCKTIRIVTWVFWSFFFSFLLSVACNKTLHGISNKFHAGHNHTKILLLPTRNTKQAKKKTSTKFNYMPSSLQNQQTHSFKLKEKKRRNKAKQNETCNSSRLNLFSMWSDCRRA